MGRLLGLVRDVVVAYFFGAQADTDAFFLAYKIPYLLVLMVAGALTATFVPLFSYRLATGRKKEAWDLSVNIGNIICVVLIVVIGRVRRSGAVDHPPHRLRLHGRHGGQGPSSSSASS